MHHPRPRVKDSIPPYLPLPEIQQQDLHDWRLLQPGQLIRHGDGSKSVVVHTTHGADREARATVGEHRHRALCLLRVGWPDGGVMPLGETCWHTEKEAEGLMPLHLLGAWYHPQATPSAPRVLNEAIRRGFITAHTCGVPWPLCPTLQLSDQATQQIERYLFEVARSTGCAFPFHDIALALRNMHLLPRPDNPSLCDLQSEGDLRRHHADDLLSLWAREVRQRMHGSEWGPL